ALDGLGATDAERARNAAQLFTAFADRFNAVHRAPRFAVARAKISKGWLSPSTIYRDTSVWMSRTDSLVSFTGFGKFLPFGYVLQERNPLPPVVALADARHLITLHPTPEHDWEWNAKVDFAIGTVKADEMAHLFASLLAAGEGHGDKELKAEIQHTIPNTALAASKLFDLDSLRALPLADGSSGMLLQASTHPERIAATLPGFSTFAKRYLVGSSWRLQLRDKQGATWFFIDGRNGVMQLRWRVHHGELLPFEGGARPMPDDLELEIETRVKVGIFNVGLSNLVADFTFVHTPTERGWLLHMNRPPKWHLPLGVARLIDGSLKRPFNGEGSTVRFGFRDNEGGPTTISRSTHGFVRESAIVRWMGGLSGTVAGEFGATEQEEARFLTDIFAGMRKDAASMYGARP
ncbi:MAG: hypothetical protein HY275_19235, partial [Gemmatimonadetes bacterium]|nr:hypothetical protein [Gemmatimonadota bacterium]